MAAQADPYGSITGTLEVAGTPNRPVTAYGVTAWTTAGVQAQFTTSVTESGQFWLAGLAPGQYRLQFDRTGETDAILPYWRGASSLSSSPIVTVSAGVEVDLGTMVAPRGGSISGSVTGGGQILPFGGSVSLLKLDGAEYRIYELNGSSFELLGIPAGSYRLKFQSTSRAFGPEYWNDSVDLSGSTPVVIEGTVALGGFDVDLAPRASVAGSVQDESGTPLRQIAVSAYDAAGELSGWTETGTGGDYLLGGLDPGAYTFRFSDLTLDRSGAAIYVTEWWGDSSVRETATPIVLARSQNATGINATLTTGATISGTVSYVPLRPASAEPVVFAYYLNPVTQVYEIDRGVHPETDGSFVLGGLRAGPVWIEFVDPNASPLTRRFWPKAATIGQATAITLTAGEARTGIDGSLLSPTGSPFVDVPVESSFATEIEWMRVMGYSTGYSGAGGAAYHPYENVSRGAIAAFLYRAAGSPAFTAPTTPTFSDVRPDNLFYTAIEWMWAQGLTTGNPGPGGTLAFNPLAPTTREVMAAFLYRYAHEPAFAPPSTPSFRDIPSTDRFFAAIEWMRSMRISTGYVEVDGATYRPHEDVTRGAMAAFLYRFLA